MPAVPFSEALAESVAAALNGQEFGYTFTRSRLPTYALKDIKEPKTHVVPIWPVRMESIDEGAGTATSTPVIVTVDAACEKSNEEKVAALTAFLESIATFLAAKNVDGAGYPIEDVLIERNEDYLNQGHFLGTVAAVYRVYRDTPRPLVDEDDE